MGTAVSGPPNYFSSSMAPPVPAPAQAPFSAIPEYAALPAPASSAYPNIYQQQQQQPPSTSYPNQPTYSFPQPYQAAQPQGYPTSAPSLSVPPQPNPYYPYPSTHTPQPGYPAVPAPAPAPAVPGGGGNQSAYFFGGVDSSSPTPLGAFPAAPAASQGPYYANPNPTHTPTPILAPPANFNPAASQDPTQQPDFARKVAPHVMNCISSLVNVCCPVTPPRLGHQPLRNGLSVRQGEERIGRAQRRPGRRRERTALGSCGGGGGGGGGGSIFRWPRRQADHCEQILLVGSEVIGYPDLDGRPILRRSCAASTRRLYIMDRITVTNNGHCYEIFM